MKTLAKKTVACVAVVLAVVCTSMAVAQTSKFYYNEVIEGGMIVSKIVYTNSGALKPYMKHDFTYDAERRVSTKESFKWSEDARQWVPCAKLSISYTSDNVIVDYGVWNKKAKAYCDKKEQNVYQLDEVGDLVELVSYKWNRDGRKIVNRDITFKNNESLWVNL